MSNQRGEIMKNEHAGDLVNPYEDIISRMENTLNEITNEHKKSNLIMQRMIDWLKKNQPVD